MVEEPTYIPISLSSLLPYMESVLSERWGDILSSHGIECSIKGILLSITLVEGGREGGLAILALVGRWEVFGHYIILLIQIKRNLCVVVWVVCTVLCSTTNLIAQKFLCSVNYTSVKISDLFTCTAHSKAYAGGCL